MPPVKKPIEITETLPEDIGAAPDNPSTQPSAPDGPAEPPPDKTKLGKPGKPSTQSAGKGRKAAAGPAARPIAYPQLAVGIRDSTGDDDPPLSIKEANTLLGFETEEQYVSRMRGERPKQSEAKSRGDFALHVFCTDMLGQPVVCWNNNQNRPYEEERTLQYVQDILNRKWAGPLTMPGETINCEGVIVIGRRKEVISGQKRLLALIFAGQILSGVRAPKDEDNKFTPEQTAHWRKLWPDGKPVLETLLALGNSEAECVVATVDTAQPRKLADVFYTSKLFRTLPGQDPETKAVGRRPTSMLERRLLGRTLSWAVDLFWDRTGCKGNDFHGFKSHGETLGLVDRHPRLVEAVEHLFIENNADGKPITELKLSPGHCAALLYLMAASGSDGDAYRRKDLRSEKVLDFSLWDKACEYFVHLANRDNGGPLYPVREAIRALENEDDLVGGKTSERHAILLKGWSRFLADEPIADSDLLVEYNVSKATGLRTLDRAALPKLEGIDLGEPAKKKPEDAEAASPEEAAAAERSLKETTRQQLADAAAAEVAAKKAIEAGPNAKGEKPVLKTRQQLDVERQVRKQAAEKEAAAKTKASKK